MESETNCSTVIFSGWKYLEHNVYSIQCAVIHTKIFTVTLAPCMAVSDASTAVIGYWNNHTRVIITLSFLQCKFSNKTVDTSSLLYVDSHV